MRPTILAFAAVCAARIAHAEPDPYSPLSLFATAQSLRLRGDCERAALFYHAYLRARPDAGNREDAAQFAAESEACAATQRSERRHALVVVPPFRPPPRLRALRDAGLATVGIGVVAAGVGAYFGLEALQERYQLEELCRKPCEPSAAAALDGARRSDMHTAVVMYVIGGIAVATGASMFAWARMHAGPDTVIVAPTPGGAAVSTTLRF